MRWKADIPLTGKAPLGGVDDEFNSLIDRILRFSRRLISTVPGKLLDSGLTETNCRCGHCRGRSVRSVLAVATTILAFGAIAQTASAADEIKPLSISKECSQYTGGTPSFCTITESSLDSIPAGT